MNSTLRNHVAAMLLIAPAAAMMAAPAAAQQAVVAVRPVVSSLALNADHGLAPGSTLRLQLRATPGARSADVTLGDSSIRVPLRERAAGNYGGSHVVRRSDRIDPFQLMTARATYGNRSIVANFSYPAAFKAPAIVAPPTAIAPVIERFVMRPMGRLQPGQELRLRLVGVPGAQAWVDIPGVVHALALQETRPGVYQGSYTIRRRDNPEAFADAVATLQSGNLRATAGVQMRGRGGDYGRGRDDHPPQNGRWQ